jgi:hypothetical protein
MHKPQPGYPKMPFVLMNRHHIILFGQSTLTFDGTWKVMGEQAFLRGKFKEDAVAIDVDCKKYPLLDVVNLGKSWNPLDLFAVDRAIKVRYVFGEPVQLTFDEARHEIVELICSRKWYGQTGGTEKHFRQTRAQARDMREFLIGRYGIGFYGRWMMHYVPPKRRQPKKAAKT